MSTIYDAIHTNILEVAGIDARPDEEKETFLKQATTFILEQALARAKERLTPEQQKQFARAFSKDSPQEERAAFLKTAVPDLEDIILQETLAFKKALLDMTLPNK